MFIFCTNNAARAAYQRMMIQPPPTPKTIRVFSAYFFIIFQLRNIFMSLFFAAQFFYCMFIACKMLSLRQQFSTHFNFLAAQLDQDPACYLDICIKHMGKEEKELKMEHIARATFVQNCILLSGLVLNKFSSLSCPVKASKLVNYNCNAGYKKF